MNSEALAKQPNLNHLDSNVLILMDPVRLGWRNIITLALVLVFVPVSVVSAMPIVWCTGAGGHEAVEFSHRSVQHGARTEHDDGPAHTHVEHDGCRDQQLMDASKSARANVDGIVPFTQRAVLPLPDFRIAGVVARRLRLADHPPAPPDPLPAALRSVILLI